MFCVTPSSATPKPRERNDVGELACSSNLLLSADLEGKQSANMLEVSFANTLSFALFSGDAEPCQERVVLFIRSFTFLSANHSH
jgi:hypothetical protein